MISYFFASKEDEKQQRMVHISRGLLADSDYGFEIKEIISLVSAKPILEFKQYIDLQHIIWILNNENTNLIINKLKEIGVEKGNIKTITIGPELEGKNLQNISNFYLSEVKYRKKNIINPSKIYYIERFCDHNNSKIFLLKVRMLNGLRRRLYKIFPGFISQISQNIFLELVSPEKSYVNFGKVDTTNIDNQRLDIIAILSGLSVLRNGRLKDGREILNINRKLKNECIKTLLLTTKGSALFEL